MPVKPTGSLLVFTSASATSTVAIDGEARKQVRLIDFERKEYDKAYRLNLPEEDGHEPILIRNLANGFIQFDFNCGSASSIRDVTPNDDVVDDILKSMTIKTWTIKGGPSSPTEVEELYTVAVDHAKRLRSFDGYQKLFSLKLSSQFVEELKNSNFSYLTSTGLSVSGAITESNILIRSFDLGVTHYNPKTSTIVTKDWSMQFDVITIENMRTYTG